MNKKELIEIIKEVVRAEIRSSGPEMVREALLESLQSKQNGLVEGQTFQMKRSQPPLHTERPQVQPQRQQRVFSTDPVLNKILNETSGGVPSEEEAMVMSQDLTSHIPKEVLAENKDLAAVASALTRDYRSVIRAADEKAKKNRP